MKFYTKFLGFFCAFFMLTHTVNAEVSYNSETKTLTVIGSTTVEEIRPYSEAIELIIKDASGMTNMANQYGQSLPNIEKLILPVNIIKTIGEEAFMSTAIGPTFYVPNSVEEIKKGAFEDCDSIKTLIFDEGSQIQHIYSRAFYQDENNIEGKLSDVYINVKPARMIVCDNGAFDKYHTAAQTNVGTVMTRLHYPSELFEYYVGTYKSTLYDQNYDVKDKNGNWVEDENHQRVHSYGIVTQSIINQAFEKASNGWQEFFSSGIPIGSESLYRTFSDNVAYKVPYTSEFQIYLVVDYDKTSNTATCIQMNYNDIIPANTGVIVHSNVVSTIYLEYVKEPEIIEPYNNESYPNNLYRYNEDVSYKNYLKPINGSLHIDNVEIVDGVKTYRNYFFNNGKTAANRKGPDWDDKYLTEGWGFFRATSGNYRVFNKAYLHLPVSMTSSDSEHINDSGNLPQDNAQAQAKAESFTMYILNWEDL